MTCCEPEAAVVACTNCGAEIKTCERKEEVHGDYRCPEHPNGCELHDGRWACTEACYDALVGVSE